MQGYIMENNVMRCKNGAEKHIVLVMLLCTQTTLFHVHACKAMQRARMIARTHAHVRTLPDLPKVQALMLQTIHKTNPKQFDMADFSTMQANFSVSLSSLSSSLSLSHSLIYTRVCMSYVFVRHTHTYVYIYIHTHTSTHTHTCVCVCGVCVCVCVCVYVYMYIYTSDDQGADIDQPRLLPRAVLICS